MASQPAQEFRLGLIKACIWRKRTRAGVKYAVTVHRLYRNGDEWKQSSRFSRDDVPQVRLALDLAHTWIFQQSSNKS